MSVNKPKSIEDLAYAIKFDYEKYRKTEIVRFRSDLASALLMKLNLRNFAEPVLNVDSNLEQNNKYDGEVFAKAFKSALESYGKLDEKTGEKIPFEIIFGSHYKTKKPQIKINKYKENNYRIETKIKNNVIQLFLEEQAKKLGNVRLPSDLKVSKIDDCINFLKSLNANNKDKEEAINKLVDLYTDKYVKRVKAVADDGEDEETSITDFAGQEEQIKETVIDKITDGIDKTLAEIEDKSLLEYAKYYITMKIILKYKIIGFDNQILDEYIDKGLEKFYYEKYSNYTDEKYIKDIIADYIGKKPDTVRKKLDKVKKLIQNSMLKNISKK